MKKILAALALTAAVSSVNAGTILLDNFNGPRLPSTGFNTDSSVDGSGVCDNDGVRMICSNRTSADPDGAQETFVSTTRYVTRRGDFDNSVEELKWNLPRSLFVSPPANTISEALPVGTILNSLTFSDINGDFGTQVAVLLNGAQIGSASTAAGTTPSLTINFGPFVVSAGQVLTVRLTNATRGWDFSADSVSLGSVDARVPAPALPILIGVGLIAVGLRRKHK
jgi:hypothetical protein